MPAVAIRKLSPECAAYIAGLIDGEGTITLTRLHANEMRRLVVSIANNELQLLDFVKRALGAGKITRKCHKSGHHSPSYCFALTSRQALSLLEQTTSYLRSHKRQRAELALSSYERLTPRNGRYTPELLKIRQDFESRLLAITANDCF
jgi:hypothetical protein